MICADVTSGILFILMVPIQCIKVNSFTTPYMLKHYFLYEVKGLGTRINSTFAFGVPQKCMVSELQVLVRIWIFGLKRRGYPLQEISPRVRPVGELKCSFK